MCLDRVCGRAIDEKAYQSELAYYRRTAKIARGKFLNSRYGTSGATNVGFKHSGSKNAPVAKAASGTETVKFKATVSNDTRFTLKKRIKSSLKQGASGHAHLWDTSADYRATCQASGYGRVLICKVMDRHGQANGKFEVMEIEYLRANPAPPAGVAGDSFEESQHTA